MNNDCLTTIRSASISVEGRPRQSSSQKPIQHRDEQLKESFRNIWISQHCQKRKEMRKIRKSIRLAIEKAMDMLVRLFVEKFCFSGESGDHHGNLMVHCDDCDNLRHGRTQFACSLAKSLGNSSPGTRTCRNMPPRPSRRSLPGYKLSRLCYKQ